MFIRKKNFELILDRIEELEIENGKLRRKFLKSKKTNEATKATKTTKKTAKKETKKGDK